MKTHAGRIREEGRGRKEKMQKSDKKVDRQLEQINQAAEKWSDLRRFIGFVQINKATCAGGCASAQARTHSHVHVLGDAATPNVRSQFTDQCMSRSVDVSPVIGIDGRFFQLEISSFG